VARVLGGCWALKAPRARSGGTVAREGGSGATEEAEGGGGTGALNSHLTQTEWEFRGAPSAPREVLLLSTEGGGITPS